MLYREQQASRAAGRDFEREFAIQADVEWPSQKPTAIAFALAIFAIVDDNESKVKSISIYG